MKDQAKNSEQLVDELIKLRSDMIELVPTAAKPRAPKPDLPDNVLSQWQGIVDLMAMTCRVPAGLIMKVHPSEIEVLISAKAPDNPYHPGEKALLNTGLYCETVMSTRERLLVANALKDPEWDHNPDIPLGMVCYLGYPLMWPDGEIFGTICILDNKENTLSAPIDEYVKLFRENIENYLALLFEANDRRRAQNDLQATLSRFYTILSNLYGGVLLVTNDGAVEFANQAFCDLFDLDDSPGELHGLNAPEMIGKIRGIYANPDEAIARIMEIVAQNSPVKSEEIAIVGGRTYIRDFIPVLVDGKPYGRFWHHSDITEIKRTAEALTESEGKYRLLFKNGKDAVVVHEVESMRFIDANPAAEALWGYTVSELLTMTPVDLSLEPDKTSEALKQAAQPSGTQVPIRWQRKRDGSSIAVEISASLPFTWKNRNVLVSIVRDISDRIRAEQEKEALQTQLFQSQKLEALGTLVGGIAHDFNNMLQSIMGYSEMLLIGKKKGEPGYEDLQTIIRTGKDGAELVNKLLAFGQQGQVIPVPLDLNNQINQLSTLISHTLPQLVQVELDLANGPTTIRADHAQIEQLIMNLAINASEAMPTGGRLKIATKTVSLNDEYCRSHPGVKSGSYVMLSVSDTGRGIDEQTVARIFDPFFSTKERGATRGTGLGLSVVKGIVQQQGGHVTCESEPGKGTTFKVYLPAIEAIAVTAKTVMAPVQSGGAEKILVVEDNIPVAELEQRALENAGYTVIVATNGQEALEIYQTRKEQISLVILDLLMPEMSGRDCLMELIKIDPSVKVLIASGYAPEDELHKEISPLVKGFVHKPFAITELLNEARSALDSY